MTEMTRIEFGSAAEDEPLKADCFFKAGYRASGAETSKYIEELAVEVLGRKVQTPKNREKYLACMTDFLAMVGRSGNGLVAWQTGAEHYLASTYSRKVAEETRHALSSSGYLMSVQGPTKELCRIYQVDKDIAPGWLEFQKNNSTNVVKVRENKLPGKKTGRLIRFSRFKPETVRPIIKDMEALNDMMEAHPLEAQDGTVWDGCNRLFNNGDPSGQTWNNLGGRVYGDWQFRSEEERLQFTIDDQEVCEVDIKACYLFLALQSSQYEFHLPEDPYQLIEFVREERDETKRKQKRQLAKLLVSAILSKDGPVTRFPKGRLRSGGKGRHSLRNLYDLGKKAKCKDFVHQIEEVFPFIAVSEKKGLQLMFEESEVIVGSMLALWSDGIPTFPVHDCLLCKRVDEGRVVTEIQEQMEKRYQSYATLEVGYRDGSSKIYSSSQNIGSFDSDLSLFPPLRRNKSKEDDPYDYSVIEDF